MIDRVGLAAPMAGDSCRAGLFEEGHRAALKAACAEDLDVWPVYATSWDPEHFDVTFDLIMALKRWHRFVIFSDDALVGMSCFINVDPQRGALEIGNTYYVPRMRGTGFNRVVKDLMLRRAIACGFRRISTAHSCGSAASGSIRPRARTTVRSRPTVTSAASASRAARSTSAGAGSRRRDS